MSTTALAPSPAPAAPHIPPERGAASSADRPGIPAGDRPGTRPVILTGDRTTGPLHLGHYAGSLRNRVALQHSHRQYLLLADAQALTDNAGDPGRTARNVIEVAIDYLACGIDPAVTTICVQSALPALPTRKRLPLGIPQARNACRLAKQASPEIAMLYLNFVTVARLERNPTIRHEIEARGFAPLGIPHARNACRQVKPASPDIPAGFLCYPAAQAADITAFKATVVPVGASRHSASAERLPAGEASFAE